MRQGRFDAHKPGPVNLQVEASQNLGFITFHVDFKEVDGLLWRGVIVDDSGQGKSTRPAHLGCVSQATKELAQMLSGSAQAIVDPRINIEIIRAVLCPGTEIKVDVTRPRFDQEGISARAGFDVDPVPTAIIKQFGDRILRWVPSAHIDIEPFFYPFQ
jgi:hypothetical protein